jgi:hypothetical protein
MYNISNNITEVQDLFVNVSREVETFAPMLLLFVWLFITMTGYFAQDRRTGKSNIPMWLTVGGFFTNILAFILFLISGIINLYVLTTSLVIFLIVAAWFMFAGND